jgi:hypothetical protein
MVLPQRVYVVLIVAAPVDRSEELVTWSIDESGCGLHIGDL